MNIKKILEEQENDKVWSHIEEKLVNEHIKELKKAESILYSPLYHRLKDIFDDERGKRDYAGWSEHAIKLSKTIEDKSDKLYDLLRELQEDWSDLKEMNLE